MTKLTIRAIRFEHTQTNVRTDPNYRTASLLKSTYFKYRKRNRFFPEHKNATTPF